MVPGNDCWLDSDVYAVSVSLLWLSAPDHLREETASSWFVEAQWKDVLAAVKQSLLQQAE
jgi:hypothetical protein